MCLQGAASSAAPAKQGHPADATLLAYGEELPPEDCTEGADESDDGGARRLLRSHAAAAAANGPNGGFKRAAYQVRDLLLCSNWKEAHFWGVAFVLEHPF